MTTFVLHVVLLMNSLVIIIKVTPAKAGIQRFYKGKRGILQVKLNFKKGNRGRLP